MKRTEFIGRIDKIFYSGNKYIPGGKYTLTIYNIENGETFNYTISLKAKEEFIVGAYYRVEVDEYGYILNLVLMYEKIEDYINKNVSPRSYNYIRNQKQMKMQILYYLLFALALIIILQFIKLLIN